MTKSIFQHKSHPQLAACEAGETAAENLVHELILEQVRGGYEENQFLKIEKLVLNTGSLVSVIGSNGSGKSTLLRTIMGLLPYEGSILVTGEETRDLETRRRAREIAYLPQTLRPVNMDVRTLVCHGRFSHMSHARTLGGKDLEAVEEAMELADVKDLEDKNVSGLSGGERQRAYLAMIIAQQTPFLLLDEPSTYMDVNHQIRMMQILKNLRDQGRGVILTSHDIPMSASFSDRMILMKEGRITADGEPKAFAMDPHPGTSDQDKTGKSGQGYSQEERHTFSPAAEALIEAMHVGMKGLPADQYLYQYELCEVKGGGSWQDFQ